MKTSLVVFAALCVMALARPDSVKVAEQPQQSGGINLNNPDPGFYRPSNSNNGGLNIYPDSGFANPSGGGGVKPNPSQPENYRKQYDFPGARGGN